MKFRKVSSERDMTVREQTKYKEVKREVAKAKHRAFENLYSKLDTKEGERYLYRLSTQRNQAGKICNR